MIEYGHIEKARAQVESAAAIAEVNYDLFEKGVLTEDEAKTRTRDAIRAMEFNGGARVFAFDTQGIRVVSNQSYPEGTSAWDSPQTRLMIRNALSGGGITHYQGERTLDGVRLGPVPKAAWSTHFGPWGWVIACAVYLDDVTNAVRTSLIEVCIVVGASGLLVLLIANAISRDITRALASLTDNMKKLARSDTDLQISGLGRSDEIGEMASAMKTFVSHEVQRQTLQKQLTNLAFTDSLTGVANRSIFYQSLEDVLKHAVKTGGSCALMVLDLDRFKAINDTMGHLVGDKILQEFSTNLAAHVGCNGIVGRLSGDEFFVIFSAIKCHGDLMELAEAILVSTKKPIKIDGSEIRVGASIGVAFGPADGKHETTLYQCADMAMYQAKAAGGGRALCYTEEMGQRAAEQYKIEAMISNGLIQEQFSAYFQAKIDMVTGKILGAEALCRWEDPQRRFISPKKFIPIAEKSGQIIEIGAIMLWEACKFAVDCNRGRETPFVVSVNVSAQQLHYGRFAEELHKCLAQTNCDPAWIELEITESTLLNDDDKIVMLLNEISEIGVSIAIDDFGTGYSAMSYLTRFPIDCLKIDQSFVQGMDTVKRKEILVTAILAMAHGLGLRTVAEGVETQTVSDILVGLNCDLGQGYLWHKPSTATALISRVQRESA